jgi:RNA polymerase sigma-70 factor (ECF subfamily)
LLALIKEGDRGAFDEIYERYWVKLYKTAFDRIKSIDEAEDMIQDLFIDLWMKRNSLIINISLSAYLFTAVKYKVINYIEANIVRHNYLQSLNKAIIDCDDSTNQSILCMDMERWINSEIQKLSPKVKRVFELSREENLTIREIAKKLNVSDQTVKNQIGKALKTLKVHLNNISAGFFFLCLIG